MFISRVELLPEDETVEEHRQGREEEAVLLAADRAGPGLFKGVFSRSLSPRIHYGQGVLDPEDNVYRCPECHWELEDGQCTRCGFNEYEPGDSEFDSDEESGGSQSISIHTIESDYDGEEEDLDHPFEYDGLAPFNDAFEGSISDAPDTEGYYEDDYDEMDGFVDDRDEPFGDDDANSESTMTTQHAGAGTWGPETPYEQESEDGTTESTSLDGQHHRHHRHHHAAHDDSASQTTTQGTQSDVHTNYDESTDESEQDSRPFIPSNRLRAPRIVISDDEDEEDEQEHTEVMTTENSEDDEDEDGDGDSSDNSEREAEERGSESEESDIRPPQPSSRRRQHLQSQRARRNNHSYQPYLHGQRRQSPQSQRNNTRQPPSHIRQRLPSGIPYERPAPFSRRVLLRGVGP